ncbi:MAG: LPS assembly protein LptD [Pseudomonadota bacterium]|nr:LPS assembly protein LptD [Pseudomonadota bacterium]
MQAKWLVQNSPWYKWLLALTLLVVFLCGWNTMVYAAFDMKTSAKAVEIEAKHLIYDKVLGRYIAQGEVVIRQESMELSADKVILDNRSREFEAWGDVLLRDREDYLACRYLKFNLDTKTGHIRQGRIFVKDKHFFITGREIDKLGPDEYLAKDATLTSCDAAKAAWMVSCESVHVTKGGYGVTDKAVFKVKDIPVIYLPKAYFPVKTSRQSGLLMPSIGYGQEDGLMTKNAYFWAIDEAHDATFTLETYGHRGVRLGGEYRYVLNETAKGEINGSYLHDKLVKDNEEYPHTESDRWSLGARHFQDFSKGAQLKAHLNFVSDNYFLDDFSNTFSNTFINELDDVDYETDNELRSNIILSKSWARQNLNLTAEGLYYDSLILPHNDTVLQVLPQITLTALEQPLGKTPLFWHLDSSYVNFWRDTGDRGQRFDFHPGLNYPFHLGPLEVTPSAGVRETFYLTDWEDEGSDTESRELFDAGVEVKTVMERVFSRSGTTADRFLHTLEPTVNYLYVPDVDQDEMPHFDDFDHIYEENNLTYGLVSRLIGRYADQNGGYDYHQYFKVELQQSYNLIDEVNGDQFTDNHNFSDVKAQLEYWSRKYFYGKLESEYDPNDNQTQTFSTVLSFQDKRQDRLRFEYRYERDDLEDYIVSGYLPMTPTLDIYGSARYSALEKLMWESIYGFNYHAQCWAIDFSVKEEHQPYDLQFRMLLTLNGLGTIGQQ